MTMTTIAILILAISIQMVVAPEVKPDPQLLKLFNNKDNFEKVVMVFTAACSSKEKAEQEIQKYKQTGLTPELEDVLRQVAKNPKNTYKTILKPISKEIDKIWSKNLVYRAAIKPLWGFVKGVGCLALRALGVTVYSTGDLIALLNNTAKKSFAGAGNEPNADTAEVMNYIDDVADTLKKTGNKIDSTANRELNKAQGKTKTKDSGSAKGSARETKQLVETEEHVGSKQPITAKGSDEITSP